MFPLTIFLLALASAVADPVSTAIDSYNNVNSYRVTLRSKSANSSEVIRYNYKKPGFVRMEFIKPHNGAVLVYNPINKKAKLRPFGLLKPFILTLSPDSSLIKSPTGHRVDASDIGELLKTVKRLQEMGMTEILGDEAIGERASMKIKVEGVNDHTVDGIHRYLLWLDRKTSLPIKASSYDKNGGLIEEVLMDDLETNVELPESLFSL